MDSGRNCGERNCVARPPECPTPQQGRPHDDLRMIARHASRLALHQPSHPAMGSHNPSYDHLRPKQPIFSHTWSCKWKTEPRSRALPVCARSQPRPCHGTAGQVRSGPPTVKIDSLPTLVMRFHGYAVVGAAIASCGGKATGGSPPSDSGSVDVRDAAMDVLPEREASLSDGAQEDGAALDAPAEAIDHCRGVCPAAEPALGDSCDFGFLCEYGGSPFLQCNRIYSCPQGHVVAGPVDTDSGCPSGLPPNCPAAPAPSANCTLGDACAYSNRECDCVPFNGGQPIWVCSGTDSGPGGCPVPRPKLGTPCTPTSDNLACQVIGPRIQEGCSTCGNQWGEFFGP
jgi:hypothetical protein